MSYTPGAATHQCDGRAQSALRKMSHQAAGTSDGDATPTPLGSSLDGAPCSVLVRQDACESAPSPAKEAPGQRQLATSCSASSGDLSGCPFVAERQANAAPSSNQRDKNLQSSLSVDLNQTPLVGFFSSSPSNESYSLGSDYVSARAIYLTVIVCSSSTKI